MPNLYLYGRSCPCGNGWSCDEDRNVCVRPDRSHDADHITDADSIVELDSADVDSDGADADDSNHICDWRSEITFGRAERLEEWSASSSSRHPSLSLDRLTLFYVDEGAVDWSYVVAASRVSLGAPFTEFAQVSIEGMSFGRFSVLEADRSAYFSGYRDGTVGQGGADIWKGTWLPWSIVEDIELVDTASSPEDDHDPTLTSDGRTLYFSRFSVSETGVYSADILRATRSSLSETFSSVSLVTELNTTFDELSPTVNGDGSLIVFASSRNGDNVGFDLFYSVSELGTFGTPQMIHAPSLNTADDELDPALSADGCELLFVSDREDARNYEIYRVEITP